MGATAHSLFGNIAAEDRMHLFLNGEPDGKKIVNILDYRKEDVSVAANIPMQSVRYDQKMPTELRDRIIEWAVAINLVSGYFKDDHKTMLWFKMVNPLLGDISPRDMIRVGRFKKLYKFIQTALGENTR
ncbi:MAG: hypothetical protein A2583_03115 [Bdellovibrionales bacterium RIFOXYD1_FULL_53_11]|nr:MAG: hypothetical protein A2583_03115 [Bdellovibrionales bacterium RIFOXYD1_FULL_53_11]